MKHKTRIIEIATIFILTFLFSTIVNEIHGDEIWNYGFSYNIAKGLIPYRDFNMVITPLFPICEATFMKIFGINYLTYVIFNCIIYTTVYTYIKKSTPQSYLLVFYLFLLFQYPNYNILCLLLLYILIEQENKPKQNDILIGILLGLAICTKQNIGIFLCLPTIVYIKDIKKVLKRILGAMIPILIIIIYLLINKSLYSFIDYTILGLKEFQDNNTITVPICIVILSVSLIYSIIMYFKTRKIEYLYLLFFQSIAYPIIDSNHVTTGFIPTYGYLINHLKLNKKIIQIFFTLLMIITLVPNTIKTFSDQYRFTNGIEAYKYRKVSSSITEDAIEIGNYIKSQPGKVYLLNYTSYYIKIANNLEIDKYDLLNSGNMGSGGIEQIIKELDDICQNNKCTMLINNDEVNNITTSQYSHKLYDYVTQHYYPKETVVGLTAYKNY